MPQKSKSHFLKGNPEKIMIFLFPLITLSLFVVAAILWCLVNGQFPMIHF